MALITTQAELDSFCSSLNHNEFITVDTEFLRDKTYYPILCLIQIADLNQAAVIDPLVKNLDLSPLFEILTNPKILKVFHSARQDIEVIYNISNIIPQPIFDTQVAAMFCGYGESISYESLVNQLLKIKLDKTFQHTNWASRPLLPKQIEYALGDVVYLRDVYLSLKDKLLEKNRLDWINDEIAILTNKKTYDTDVNEVWKKIKTKNRNPKFRYLIKELAIWREINARKLNIPKSHLLKDEKLLEIIEALPRNIEDFKNIKGLNRAIFSDAILIEIIDIIQTNKNKSIAHDYDQEQNFSDNLISSLLNILLKLKAEQIQISSRAIISKKELNQLSTSNNIDNLEVMQGWKYQVFGKDAILLKEGKIALHIAGSKVEIIKIKN